MIWREKRILLILLGLLLAANAIFFFTYRVQYQTRLTDLDERLDTADKQLESARAARLQAERQYQSYIQIQNDVKEVFDEHWSTEDARLTLMLAEIKRLGGASNLVPRSYAFDRKAVESAPTVSGRTRKAEIGATEVGVGFSVEGSYEQVRRLINLLELSRQFVIIDEIALNANKGQALTLTLHVKTLFRDDAAARPRVNNQRL
ncbi:MAG: hypothetical protein QOH21_1423 [Acidobacteriota bacterium]|jgi:hypothetical protein|nr:hypothetical protein [Acidobacteriota bacterium]